jgi:hypothetical protein
VRLDAGTLRVSQAFYGVVRAFRDLQIVLDEYLT